MPHIRQDKRMCDVGLAPTKTCLLSGPNPEIPDSLAYSRRSRQVSIRHHCCRHPGYCRQLLESHLISISIASGRPRRTHVLYMHMNFRKLDHNSQCKITAFSQTDLTVRHKWELLVDISIANFLYFSLRSCDSFNPNWCT